MKALNPRSITRFVPSCDKDAAKEDQTVFLLKPLTIAEESLLDDAQWKTVNGKREFSFARKCLSAIHLGLFSVENFKDDEGRNIVVSREDFENDDGIKEIKDSFLSSIPKSVRDEIAIAILSSMNPTEEQKKN